MGVVIADLKNVAAEVQAPVSDAVVPVVEAATSSATVN